MQQNLAGPPHQIDDQGNITQDTPADALFMEGQRRMESGEVMMPQIQAKPPGGDDMSDLMDFLSPGF
jgi:hypothetical protein